MEVEKNIPINLIEDMIQKEIHNKKLIAIGETGLDYHFDYSRKLQEEYFKKQIMLANKFKLPIIIHARESHNDVKNILDQHPVEYGGIMHCYSGEPYMAKDFIDMGFYLGIGGTITKSEKMQKTVEITSLDNIVLETDAPVLPPLPLSKNARNESSYLKYVIKKIAEIKNVSDDIVIEKTTQNALKIYRIQ